MRKMWQDLLRRWTGLVPAPAHQLSALPRPASGRRQAVWRAARVLAGSPG